LVIVNVNVTKYVPQNVKFVAIRHWFGGGTGTIRKGNERIRGCGSCVVIFGGCGLMTIGIDLLSTSAFNTRSALTVRLVTWRAAGRPVDMSQRVRAAGRPRGWQEAGTGNSRTVGREPDRSTTARWKNEASRGERAGLGARRLRRRRHTEPAPD